MTFLRILTSACVILTAFKCVSAVIDCTRLEVAISTSKCKQYAAYGAADVAIERLSLSRFDDNDRESFQIILANVSNEYYPSITIEPKHIAIVELFENREGVLILSFFVLNPTGSQAFPVLFRTKELHLMLELNLQQINNFLPYTINPQELVDNYPLFLPVWAIVIIVYVAIVLFIFLIVMATKNWKSDHYASSDIESEDAVPVKKSYTVYDGNDYANVRKRNGKQDSQNNDYDTVDGNKKVDQSMQTPRTVALQVKPTEIDSTTVVIEKQPDEASRQEDDDVSYTEEGESNEGYDDTDDVDQSGTTTQTTTF